MMKRLLLVLSVYACLGSLWAQYPQIKDNYIFTIQGVYLRMVPDTDSLYWGFYEAIDDTTQRIIVETDYDSIVPRAWPGRKDVPEFYEVRKGKYWGLLRADRSPWIPMQYTAISYDLRPQPHRLNVRVDSFFGILDTSGREFLAPIYDEILTDGLYFKLRKNKKWGLASLQGEVLIAPCFDWLIDHETLGRSLLKRGDKWTAAGWHQPANAQAYCDLPVDYDYIEYVDDVYLVRKGELWGVLNLAGKPILPLEYQGAANFFLPYQKAFLVKKNEKLGLLQINAKEEVKTIIPIEYDDILIDEVSAKIKVRKGEFWDYIFEGEPYLGLRYNDLTYYAFVGVEPNKRSADVFMVKKGKVWGMVDGTSRKELVAPAYQRIFMITPQDFVVQKKNKWGMISRQGKEKIPIVYDSFEYDPEKRTINMQQKNKAPVPYKVR